MICSLRPVVVAGVDVGSGFPSGSCPASWEEGRRPPTPDHHFKIGKWCCQALVGGVQSIQFGYASRAHAKNNKQHVLIGTQTIRTPDLAKQLNLSEANVWGVVDEILGLLAPLADGKYVLMRSPNEPMLKLFAVPDGSLEDGFGRA